MRAGLSQRRSCALAQISRSCWAYAKRANDDEPVLVQLRAFAQQEKRAGYWRAYRALRDQGLRINHKRVQRLWPLAELQVPPRRRRKRRRAASKSVPLQATFPRHVTPALAAQVQVSPTIFSKIRRWMGANCGA